jgi:hypothetical protein
MMSNNLKHAEGSKIQIIDYVWVCLLAVNFSLWHPYVQSYFNSVRQMTVAVSALALIQVPYILKAKHLQNGFVLFIPLIVFLLYLLAGFGDNKLVVATKFYLYSIPYFVLGYKMVIWRQERLKFLFIVLLLFPTTIVAIVELSKIFIGLNTNLTRGIVSQFILGTPNSVNLVFYFPSLSLVALLSVGLFSLNNLRLTIMAGSCQLILFVFVFFSSFSAPILVFVGGFVLLFLFRSLPTKNLIGSTIAIFVILLALSLIIQNQNIYSTKSVYLERLQMIPDLFSTKDYNTDNIDMVTNGRMVHIVNNLNIFLAHPIFGIGYFYENDVGQHSFIFDVLASFGIIGTIPILFLFIYWISKGLKNIKTLAFDWLNLSCVTIVFSIFLFSAFNPYIFHSRMDFIIFFAGGIICGNSYLIQKNKCKVRIGYQNKLNNLQNVFQN